jgi:hypothetical protein
MNPALIIVLAACQRPTPLTAMPGEADEPTTIM